MRNRWARKGELLGIAALKEYGCNPRRNWKGGTAKGPAYDDNPSLSITGGPEIQPDRDSADSFPETSEAIPDDWRKHDHEQSTSKKM